MKGDERLAAVVEHSLQPYYAAAARESIAALRADGWLTPAEAEELRFERDAWQKSTGAYQVLLGTANAERDALLAVVVAAQAIVAAWRESGKDVHGDATVMELLAAVDSLDREGPA